MSVHQSEDNRKVTTHRLVEMKQRGEKVSMLTIQWPKLLTRLEWM